MTDENGLCPNTPSNTASRDIMRCSEVQWPIQTSNPMAHSLVAGSGWALTLATWGLAKTFAPSTGRVTGALRQRAIQTNARFFSFTSSISEEEVLIFPYPRKQAKKFDAAVTREQKFDYVQETPFGLSVRIQRSDAAATALRNPREPLPRAAHGLAQSSCRR